MKRSIFSPAIPRTPAHLNINLVDRAQLTLETARTRQPELTDVQCAERLLAALHEAVHYVSMVEEGDAPFEVVIPRTYTSRSRPARVKGARSGMYEREYVVTLLGAAFEWAIFNFNNPHPDHATAAFWNDADQAESEKKLWTDEPEAEPERFADGLYNWLTLRWPLIDFTATAFLLHADRKGAISRTVIDELSDVIRERLDRWDWPKGNRSEGLVRWRNSLPLDALAIWREANPRQNSSSQRGDY